MNITAGLYPYEVVMLILGVILFLVLIFSLLYMVLHGKKIGSLLAFFLLPIAMIGYPSIQSIQYKDGVLTLEKQTQQLLNNPQDSATRGRVQQEVSALSNRPATSPWEATVVAKAQYSIGDEKAATGTIQRVFQMAPDYPEAVKLQKKIDTVNQVAELASKVEQNPSDEAAKARLQQTVSAVKQTPLANPVALAHLAHAESVLGDHQAAMMTIDKAIAIQPQAPLATNLKATIAQRAAGTTPH